MMTPPLALPFTVPAELIRISSGAPALTVEVRTGPVTAVAMVVSAASGDASAAKQVEASKK